MDSTNCKHYWVTSSPFANSYLFVSPLDPVADSLKCRLSFFDPDGFLCNEAAVLLRQGGSGVIEIKQFLGSCKLESGIKHAHLVLEADPKAFTLCRLLSKGGMCFLGDAQLASPNRSAFSPVVFGANRKTLLCIVNQSKDEAHLRIQLFCGSRVPETELILPALGSRVMGIEPEFEQFLLSENLKTHRGYLRFGVRGAATLGIQVLEAYGNENGEDFLSAFC